MFLILSLVARDVLAISVSTVASESTFRTGGSVLDSFRSSCSTKIIRALICCQDWIRSSEVEFNVEKNIEDLNKFEEGKLALNFLMFIAITLRIDFKKFYCRLVGIIINYS